MYQQKRSKEIMNFLLKSQPIVLITTGRRLRPAGLGVIFYKVYWIHTLRY